VAQWLIVCCNKIFYLAYFLDITMKCLIPLSCNYRPRMFLNLCVICSTGTLTTARSSDSSLCTTLRALQITLIDWLTDSRIPSELWRCWLGGTKGIRPVKLSGGMLAWLCVWVKVQICIRSRWCHCHSLSLAPVNPEWFYLPGFTFLVPAHPGSVCVCF